MENRALSILSTRWRSILGVGLLGLTLAYTNAKADLKKVSDSDLFVSKFLPYKDIVVTEINRTWPTLYPKSTIAAQIEQETCVSAKSSKCWNPRAELKTDREYGFGLGQITITKTMNVFEDSKKLDVSLRDWKWEDRYDPGRQIRVIVLMDRKGYNRLPFVTETPNLDRLAMTLAAYNGGMGGLLSDRRLCQTHPDCNPNLWWGNVEKYSNKNHVPIKGYGKSFFDINREYPRGALYTRRVRYKAFFNED